VIETDIPQVRNGVGDDLLALTAIYNHYVVSSHCTFDVTPLESDERRSWLEHYHPRGRHRLLVATLSGDVCAYATSSAFRTKPAYDTSVEVSAYCRPDCRGRGLGRLLYEALFEVLRHEDVHRAYAGVALPNDASVALHRHFGFVEAGLFHEVGWKFGHYWDVQWLEKEFNQNP